MLDLRRLDILHRFATRGTITATAADLGYSPSAVSQQLAALEREVGVALIERTAQSASLTDAGRELVEHAAGILDAVETAHSRMHARAGTISGRVSISCIPALAPVLAPHLAALQGQHRELAVVAHETGSTTAAAAVIDRRYDLAVIDDWSAQPPTHSNGLAVHHLRREEVGLAVAADHPLTRAPLPISAARLREAVHSHTWLCAPVGQLSRTAGDLRLASVDADPARRWEFEGLHVLAALVATGAGIAFLPDDVARAQPGLAALPLAPRMHRTILALTRPTTREDPVIAACLGAVQEAMRR
ncbi:LysR family transcriptional regulator [Streptomyces sp. NPDC057743]|uniref:LysR family transcriptional regulator n=1 Tax=Streptomyces sp. NPDC057743 TaxID=3346236 RepID=UPI0036AD6E5D